MGHCVQSFSMGRWGFGFRMGLYALVKGPCLFTFCESVPARDHDEPNVDSSTLLNWLSGYFKAQAINTSKPYKPYVSPKPPNLNPKLCPKHPLAPKPSSLWDIWKSQGSSLCESGANRPRPRALDPPSYPLSPTPPV